MLVSSHRPQHRIGQPSFTPHSLEEEPVRVIAIVTEGSKEELQYLQAFYVRLEEQSDKHVSVHFLNELILEERLATEERASHPLRRLELMKDFLSIHNPDYRHYPDEAWIVCDRDMQSFRVEEYEEVYGYCFLHSIGMIVSNPAFQVWLLFHYDRWLPDCLYEDGLSSKGILTRIERRLKKKMPKYKHGTLEFSCLATRVQKVMLNSSYYPTNIADLKKEIGTNFSDLVQSLVDCYQ